MKITVLTYLQILCIITLASCAGNRGASSVADFDKKIYKPDYASGFEILGSDDGESVIIKTENPWQGAEGVSRSLFICRNGEKVPEGFDGEVMYGNAMRIVTMSSSHIAMLQTVGATDAVVGVSGINFITSPEIQSRRNEIADVGYDGNIDYEKLIAARPDLVFLYGVNGAHPMEKKLRELSIPFVYIGEYLEESPLGKAEWLVAAAECLGYRQKGEQVFSTIPEKYNSLRKLVADSIKDRPKIMLNMPYGDTWFMPPADSYMVTLIKDAGGEYVFAENKGNTSVAIDLEKAYKMTSEADFWLNLGNDIESRQDVLRLMPKFATTPPVVNGRLYNNTRRATLSGGNDFFETGVVTPDIILRDLIVILHPQLRGKAVLADPVYYEHITDSVSAL